MAAAVINHNNRTMQGVSIDSYAIGSQIGRGSFATVYKGENTKTGSAVAIKSALTRKLSKRLLENLESEISILKTLHHPHIVSLIDCQRSSNYIHIVMEYCSLGDLSNFIKRREKSQPLASLFRAYPSPPDGGINQVLYRHFLIQLSSALTFLRDRNLMHRDIKPQNLLICSPASSQDEAIALHYTGCWFLPVLKIADFGFARSLPNTSMAETLCGSPLYMAPEILRFEKYDAKADLWSVGTVLYEMVVGKPPFKASNHVELLRRIERAQDHIKFPDAVHIPSDIKLLIKGLLRRNPVERISYKEYFASPVLKSQLPTEKPSILVINQDETKDSNSANLAKKAATAQISRVDAITTNDDNIQRKNDFAILAEKPSPSPSPTTVPPIPPPTAPSTPLNDVISVAGGSQTLRRSTAPSSSSRPVLETSSSQDRHITPSPDSSLLIQAQGSYGFPSSAPPITTVSNRRRLPSNVSSAGSDDGGLIENDYVVVEKKAVELNSLADEVAGMPVQHAIEGRNKNNYYYGAAAAARLLNRRASSNNRRNAAAATSAVQAVQNTIDNNQAPRVSRAQSQDQGARPLGGLERRLSSYTGTSPTSALARALTMASMRLFGKSEGTDYPNFNPGSPSAGPSTMVSLISGRLRPITNPTDGEISNGAIDEGQRSIISYLESAATKSNVIYQFAEVKYSQLIPIGSDPNVVPSSPASHLDIDLTEEAVSVLSEEALVLYVKSLSLLVKAMDAASKWWMKQSRQNASERLNEIVQWTRDRFNETLEKANYVRSQLSRTSAGFSMKKDGGQEGGSSEKSTSHSQGGHSHIFDARQTLGNVTAEKLIYDRAIEISRQAAVNEVVGEDLYECEIAYETSIWMLEALLDYGGKIPGEDGGAKAEVSYTFVDGSQSGDDTSLDDEDVETVKKFIASIRYRLEALLRKVQAMQVGTSTQQRRAPSISRQASYFSRDARLSSSPSSLPTS